MFTKQQTFDKVKTHLMEQQKKALSLSNTCCYRAADGSKCAVGCLIPDELYSRDLEGYSVWSHDYNTLKGPTHLMVQLGHDLLLLRDLQECHDSYDVSEWPKRLSDIASKHSLTL